MSPTPPTLPQPLGLLGQEADDDRLEDRRVGELAEDARGDPALAVEAPILEEVSQGFASGTDAPDTGAADTAAASDVTFVGVNVRDQAGTAASFEKKYGVTYPSILDVESGSAQLAFAGPVPPAAVPTTIVLDRQGRVAARILGQLTDASILESIIDGLLAEQA